MSNKALGALVAFKPTTTGHISVHTLNWAPNTETLMYDIRLYKTLTYKLRVL